MSFSATATSTEDDDGAKIGDVRQEKWISPRVYTDD